MPLGTDPNKVRQIIFDILRNHSVTLNTPAPTVQLDSIDSGSMMFVCTAYVNNPRDSGTVKSDLLFEILDRLRKADLPLTTPQDMVVRTMQHDPATAPSPSTTVFPGKPS
jgi:small-conductance mechanosensitive channel